MLGGTLVVYCPLPTFSGRNILVGLDYVYLHMHRIRYAQDALFGASPHLPAWHTRELMGAPFWSNAQNFPFLPTRLPLLFIDPLLGFVVGVNLAAALAAWFTYLYGRRIGLAPVSAAVAGWTFAAAGFFASRVLAGQITLLEAYPLLPAMLWLTEGTLRAGTGRRRRPWLLGLAAASSCGALAGHPQIPAYAIGATAVYALYRAPLRANVRALAAMLLGIGGAGFVWYPMLALVLRSTRVLPLSATSNDIVIGYRRLAAFLFPWRDGWPSPITPPSPLPWASDPANFWDTVCYVGWLPVLAAVFLAARLVRSRRLPSQPWPFIVTLGLFALLLALPFVEHLRGLVPGTILRSPARQLYLTTFALAMGLGSAVDVLLRAGGRKLGAALVALGVTAHALDLARHDNAFIRVNPTADFAPRSAIAPLLAATGDGRMAVDYQVWWLPNEVIDDIRFYDSIVLARPYRAVLDLAGKPPDLNVELLNGPDIGVRALAATGTKVVVPLRQELNLPLLETAPGIRAYAVPTAAPRTAFIPFGRVLFLAPEAIHQRLRDPAVDVQTSLMLPAGADVPRPDPHSAGFPEALVTYERPSADVIRIHVATGQPGFVRVLESFDVGWSATVDGKPTPVLPADDFALAVRVEAGRHEVRFRFTTPGARIGIAISFISLTLLAAFVFRQGRLE